jgi:phage/plasmid-associated DNA primase
VKTQIEAEALKGQINEQTVKIYTEGFRALEANAQVYRSIIDGFKAKTDAKRAIIDGYTAYVQGQKAIVETNVAKAQFYAEKVRAEGLKQENYKIRAETYSAAIQGWSQASQAEIERYKAELQRLEIEARSYSTMLERQKFLLDVERTRIGAIGNDNQALVGAYGIASNAAISANEGKVRRVLALLEEAKAKSQIALQNGEINIRNGISATDLELRKYETLSQVFSNLTASFAAAINVNAGIQDTASSSQSCGQNVNFSTTFD